jgi:hypothetical protein
LLERRSTFNRFSSIAIVAAPDNERWSNLINKP